MCLTDKIFLETHVTFCEYLVFHEFKRNLYITLAKYLAINITPEERESQSIVLKAGSTG